MLQTSRSWRWLLLAVLLFGVVAMHHVPDVHRHHPERAAAPAVTALDVTTPAATAPLAATAPAAEHGSPVPGDDRAPGDAPLLHLCLAVAAALGGLLSTGWLWRRATWWATRARIEGWRALSARSLDGPVPRCLAALSVLRL